MKAKTVIISDVSFVEQFENQTLDPKHFNHVGHLRLAWLYLLDDEVDLVIEKLSVGIKAYAESLGAKQKFHLTITDAIVRLMAERIKRLERPSWSLFLQQNNDLVEHASAVIHQYYSESLLSSEAARLNVLQPDIKPIEDDGA